MSLLEFAVVTVLAHEAAGFLLSTVSVIVFCIVRWWRIK